MELICPKEVHERLISKNDLVILDIREGYELEICGIDAVHIPMEEVQFRLDEIPSDKELIIMCRSGKRAMALANLLETDFEYTDVYVMDGGILQWKELIDSNLEAY
ncbi:MAG: rhodanese-like domain-containing protein [Flavobacteriales bacterium]|nr:rhodanese-like domain-containing protein [Flavobacteriales bacterium]